MRVVISMAGRVLRPIYRTESDRAFAHWSTVPIINPIDQFFLRDAANKRGGRCLNGSVIRNYEYGDEW